MPARLLNGGEDTDLQKYLGEILTVELKYGRWIVDSDRLSIETSIEHLFQRWLGQLLGSDRDSARKILGRSDFRDFENARQEIFRTISPQLSRPGDLSQLRLLASFILVDIERGSFRKKLAAILTAGFVFAAGAFSYEYFGELGKKAGDYS